MVPAPWWLRVPPFVMTRHLLLLIATFVGGALIALVTRAALYRPHAGHEGHAVSGNDRAPRVANAPVHPAPPSAGGASPVAAKPATSPVDPGPRTDTAAPATGGRPVNTVCAICGMDVDPRLPTAQYQGQTIGFGCRMCPPKFKADPERYGPHYLRNEVIRR